MRDTVKIDWRVPSSAWEAFREHVREECGSLDGYLGYEAERAMREYADKDGGNRVEKLVDQLIRAAGRTPDEVLKQKTRPEHGDGTTRVTARVDSDVKEAFKKTVDASDTDDTYGAALARALDTYRDGGRFGRLERKLERIVDDAKSILSELAESEQEDRLRPTERRTAIICDRLPEQFTDDELREEIADVAGDSAPTIREYRDRVVDRREVEPHPNNPDLWVPKETAAELVPDGTPRECRQPVEMLDREDRVRRLKLELGRRAATRDSGYLRETAATIREDVFGGEVTKASVLDLIDTATLTDGYSDDDDGSEAGIRVNLTALKQSDPDLLAEIVAYRDGEPLDDDQGTGESPETSTETPSPESVDDEWSRLEMATDGGQPHPDRTARQSPGGDDDV